MRIYRFDAEVSRPIHQFGSDFRLTPLTGIDDGVRVVAFHVGRGGRVGRHPAVRRQLLCVSAGSGWVAGGDGSPYRITAGYAALWEEGEEHETWTDDDVLAAFVLEGEFSVPAVMVKGKPIVVEEHDPAWAGWFEQIKRHVEPALGDVHCAIEHVGSTSVAGLAAKAVIDVDVVVSSPEHVAAAIERLEGVGYRHRGDLGIPGREAFLAPSGLPRQHLYIVVEGTKAHLDHVLLRDHLRANPADAARYGEAKRNNAADVDGDMEQYGDRKHDLVEALLAVARAERGLA